MPPLHSSFSDYYSGHGGGQVLSFCSHIAAGILLHLLCVLRPDPVPPSHGGRHPGDEIHLLRAEGPACASGPSGVRPGEPRLRPPRPRPIHRRLQRPRPPLEGPAQRLDRVRPQPQARDGGGVRGEEEGGGAGERVREAAGPAVPPEDGRHVHRRRVPGPDEGGPARRAGGSGGYGGRRRALQLPQRGRRRPGHRPRLLHGQQHRLPTQRLHAGGADGRRDGAADAVRAADGERDGAQVRAGLPQRRGGERRRDAPRRGGDVVLQAAPALAAGASGRGDGGDGRAAGLPGQRAARRAGRVLGGREPGQGVGRQRDHGELRERRQGRRRRGRRREEQRHGGRGAARVRRGGHGERGRGAGRVAVDRLRRHALRRLVQVPLSLAHAALCVRTIP